MTAVTLFRRQRWNKGGEDTVPRLVEPFGQGNQEFCRDANRISGSIAADPDPKPPYAAPRAAGGRIHLYPARNRFRVRTPDHPLLDRQGFERAAAPCDQGVQPLPPAAFAAPRRYDLEVPRHDHVPRRHSETARRRPHRAYQRGGRKRRRQPDHVRLRAPHPRDEDARAQAGARPLRHRRRDRRRAPR